MIEKSIEIDTELSPESGSWFSLWLRKIFDPAWLVAVAFHLVALLVLANWIMQNSNLQLGLEVAMDSDSFTILEEPDSLEFDFKLTEAEIQSDQEALVSEFEFDVDPVVDSISRQSMDFNYGRSLNEAMNASFDVTDLGPALLPSPGSVGGTEEDKKVAAIQSRVAKAGGKEGEVQFSLAWNTETDLDLHVITPQGERIFYRNKRSACEGVLDVDQNRDGAATTTTPVENIRWKTRPLVGRYTVLVHVFRNRGSKWETEFELMAKTGVDVALQSSSISRTDPVLAFRYVYFSPKSTPEMRERQLKSLKELQEREERNAAERLAMISGESPKAIRALWRVVEDFPHTDAALAAWLRIPGSGRK